MTQAILGALGGLGLFLIGMSIMTNALKDLAGDALRNWLARFTRSPWTGAATGAAGTAILQSSSATTVMAVGFAGAGLLTFPQALGVIFGANIGTTVTGWLVALLGFKLSLSSVVMPLIFAGSILHLLGGRRIAATGFALAGFGLIFAGITTLQLAMEGASDFVTPQSFPSDTTTGRILLVGIGVAITIVTQSSSAGVATAITAVHVGTISFSQAAAMVIGMDVGTTFTAALATVGGNVGAKRTGIAHVVYNLMTGLGAFLLLPWFIAGWETIAVDSIKTDPEIALVFFHTLFNGIGVLLVLPFTNQFARMIQWLIPTEANVLTRRLEPSFLTQSSVAIAAVQATLVELAETIFRSFAVRLVTEGDVQEMLSKLDGTDQAIAETRDYMSRIQTGGSSNEVQFAYSRSLHIIDHTARLLRRMKMQERFETARLDDTMQPFMQRLANAIAEPVVNDKSHVAVNQDLATLWKEIDQQMEPYRTRTIMESGVGIKKTNQSIASLDAFRWLRRVAYHAWRICHHLDATNDPAIEREVLANDLENDPDACSQNPH
ncbi:MAG: Na/Pi symporter [Pirellulaceae bacterium]